MGAVVVTNKAAFPSTKELIRMAERQGWDVTLQKRTAHYRFVPPDKEKVIVILPSSPSDYRGKRNGIAMLKRSGLVIEKKS